MFRFSHISYELNWKGNIHTHNRQSNQNCKERIAKLETVGVSSLLPESSYSTTHAETGRIFLAENLMSLRGKIINGGNGSRRDLELSGS